MTEPEQQPDDREAPLPLPTLPTTPYGMARTGMRVVCDDGEGTVYLVEDTPDAPVGRPF